MYNKSPEITSLNSIPTKLMVLLHGLGSDGNDLISLVPYMQQFLPEYHFLSPHGVESYDSATFGRQWFSLQDRTQEVILRLAQKNASKVQDQIYLKQQELGIENKDTVLFGFSQGAMMGVYLTLIQDKSFKAMLAFSGILITPLMIKNTATPICIVHGTEDQVVKVDESIKLATYCKVNYIRHQLLLVPNLKHSIDITGIECAIQFLNAL